MWQVLLNAVYHVICDPLVTEQSLFNHRRQDTQPLIQSLDTLDSDRDETFNSYYKAFTDRTICTTLILP